MCPLLSVLFHDLFVQITTPQSFWKPEPLFSFGVPAASPTADLTCTLLKLALQYTLH